MFIFFVICFSRQIVVFFRWIGSMNFVMVGKCWSLDNKEQKSMQVGRGFGTKSQIVILWTCECECQLVSMSMWTGWNFFSIFLITWMEYVKNIPCHIGQNLCWCDKIFYHMYPNGWKIYEFFGLKNMKNVICWRSWDNTSKWTRI